jgi:hypothetical protein
MNNLPIGPCPELGLRPLTLWRLCKNGHKGRPLAADVSSSTARHPRSSVALAARAVTLCPAARSRSIEHHNGDAADIGDDALGNPQKKSIATLRPVTSLDRPPIEPFTLTHVDTCTDFRECFMHEKDDRTVVTAIDARGARLGRPVLVGLIVSTLPVIGIFSLLYYGTYG